MPDIEPAAIESYRQNSGIKILANSPGIQAVRNNKANRSQIVFYQPGKIKLTQNLTFTAESPCMVMINAAGKGIQKIAVSDPTQKLKTLLLEINAPFTGSGANWQATWDKKKQVTTIQVTLPNKGMAGESVVLAKAGK